jgi:2-polyprenyl-6-hydroxyphenyl methylase/3-demethylubiquinone-9 3-methyltransferase
MIRRFEAQARKFLTLLLKERLDPGHAAAAVFLGIFIGIVPIYGLQTIAAVGVALLFRLNKPLTVAGTFINNPLLQPLIIFSSVELGCFLRLGSFQPLNLSALAVARTHIDKEKLFIWAIGSVALGIVVGGVGGAITAVVVHLRLRASANSALRERVRFVNGMFAKCALTAREFVRWKLRLDRIFELLAAENLGSGTVVDLGCGYGMALGFAAFGDNGRRLVGCDLDARRIAVARQALGTLNAEVTVADIRHFEFPPAGLILILDVLQYLPAAEQTALLKRCCSTLAPDGILVFRVHDRERGLRSAIAMAFERLIFVFGGDGFRPRMLSIAEYRGALENAGMQLEERRFQNRLPLAHVLFVARKPLARAAH